MFRLNWIWVRLMGCTHLQYSRIQTIESIKINKQKSENRHILIYRKTKEYWNYSWLFGIFHSHEEILTSYRPLYGWFWPRGSSSGFELFEIIEIRSSVLRVSISLKFILGTWIHENDFEWKRILFLTLKWPHYKNLT